MERSVAELRNRIRVPALHVGGWYDVFNEGSVRNFVELSRTDPEQRMLIGPWAHEPWGTTVGAQDFGPRAGGPIVDRAQVDFFRRHLDPEARAGEPTPRVRYYVLFENRWQGAGTWPPEGASSQDWYLHSEGTANTAGGDGRLDTEKPGAEPCDIYAYDPADPVPSIGGHSCCQEASAPMGAHDQTLIERRRDVLVYTGSTLDADLLLAGPVSATLWVGTTAPGVDIVARLCLVGGGRSMNLAQGAWRSVGTLGPATLEEPVRVEIPLRNVAALAMEGTRLRLHVTAGSFPMYDVNPQSGQPAARARRERRRLLEQRRHGRAVPGRRGVDPPRLDQRGPDADLGRLEAERVPDADHRPLAGDVGGLADVGFPTRDRGGEEDVALPALAHQRKHRPDALQGPEHVGLDHAAPARGIAGGERALFRDPGVGDREVDRAVPVGEGPDRRVEPSVIGHVELDHRRPAATGADLLLHPPALLGVEGDQEQAGTERGEFPGRGRADTAGAPVMMLAGPSRATALPPLGLRSRAAPAPDRGRGPARRRRPPPPRSRSTRREG